MTDVDITLFDSSMLTGFAELHRAIYGSDVEARRKYFALRFDADYSRSKAIVLIGLSGGRVVASQTYTPWPYIRRGRVYNSLQSGASMVHSDFRRRGLFLKMAKEGNRIARERGVDFFMGFPVPMSYGAFIKDGYADLGSLRWWLKPLRPVALARQLARGQAPDHPLQVGQTYEPVSRPGLTLEGEGQILLTSDQEYLDWRFPGRTASSYRQFIFESGNHWVAFTMKLSTQLGMRELKIGSIRADVPDPKLWSAALKALFAEARKDRDLAAISLLLQPSRSSYVRLLSRRGFVPTKGSGCLIVKSFIDDSYLLDAASWHVSAEDSDTWVGADDVRP